MTPLTLSDQEFQQLRRLLYQTTGISLADSKKPLVLGRLNKRLHTLGHTSFASYLRQVSGGDRGELQIMVDLLSTNETSFFREAKHFEILKEHLARRPRSGGFRVWSAACSSGEEPYTIGMVLMDSLGAGSNWEILATDISTRVLERARSGHYILDRAKTIPQHYLRQYCLKGVRQQEGTFLIDPAIRNRIQFRQLNLIEPFPDNIGLFDVIFLRNVMIYFDMETKRHIVEAMAPKLRQGGYFFIGHSETLSGITGVFTPESPSVYRKP